MHNDHMHEEIKVNRMLIFNEVYFSKNFNKIIQRSTLRKYFPDSIVIL